jgi:hypothetical protein
LCRKSTECGLKTGCWEEEGCGITE